MKDPEILLVGMHPTNVLVQVQKEILIVALFSTMKIRDYIKCSSTEEW